MPIDLHSFKLLHIRLHSLLPMAMAMLQDHNVLLLLKLCSLEGILASIISGGTVP
jgi:hypothetical protein